MNLLGQVSISKEVWDSLTPVAQQSIQEHLDRLNNEINDHSGEIKQEIVADDYALFDRQPDRPDGVYAHAEPPLSPFGEYDSSPNRRAIREFEVKAAAALKDGVDLDRPFSDAELHHHPDPAKCDYCEPGQVCEPDAIVAPGDQPPPVKNDRPAIQSLVIKDVEDRLRVGVERYGTPLQAFNGRDALWDLYQELLDAVCYTRQLLAEREGDDVAQ